MLYYNIKWKETNMADIKKDELLPVCANCIYFEYEESGYCSKCFDYINDDPNEITCDEFKPCE